MCGADRKLAWSGIAVLVVIAVELAWFLSAGPAFQHNDNLNNSQPNFLEWAFSAAFWTAVFTGALTVSTMFLWISTRQSARIAERALTEHERPWIFRDFVTVTWRHRPEVPMNDWMISLRWKNFGRAPATLMEFVFKIQDVATLASRPDYSQCAPLGIIDAMPAKDDVEFNTQPVGLAIPGIKKNGDPIQYVFWGRLKYKEMNGTEHASGFALQLIPIVSGAASHNNDAYNYYT